MTGPAPKRFAEAVAKYLGMPYALPFNFGRVAIEVALRAMDVSTADEVVLPSYLGWTVLAAVNRVGARAVFADVGPDLHVTAETIGRVLTAKTKCVIVPHLFGNVAPIDEIEESLKGSGVHLIDSAAQSFGARRAGRLVGTFGTWGIISCGPGKALAGSAGGLLVTRDRQLYERAAALVAGRESRWTVTSRVLSCWVWRRLRRYTLPSRLALIRLFDLGDKARQYEARAMSNIDGAIALELLRKLCRSIKHRRRNASALLAALGPLRACSISDFSDASTVLKLVLLLPENGPKAKEATQFLARAGIECHAGYRPLHMGGAEACRPLANTEALWDRVIWLPVDTPLKDSRRLQALAQTWSERLPGREDL